MTRLPRLFLPDQPLHVIQRGNNRETIFMTNADHRFYLRCLKEASDEESIAIHAYALMRNHVHLLVTPETESSLPKTMQSIGRRYVQYFNHIYGRTGTLWEGRYKSTLIDSERYLLTCMRYIELNPVRAKIVEQLDDYPWSSYRANAHGMTDELITPHSLYISLGSTDKERQKAYRELFSAEISREDMDNIREATNKAWALGGSSFCAKVETLTERQAMPHPRGRKKSKAMNQIESDPNF